MDQLHERLERLEQHTHRVDRQLRWWRALACGVIVLAGLTWTLPAVIAQEEDAKDKGQKGLAHRVAALEKLLKHFSREKNEIFITGANLHIVNGLGSTDCTDDQGEPIPNCPNGLGNLIVGYNERRNDPKVPDVRTGSHNAIVGEGHNFSRVGGVVVGRDNTISGDFAAVSGGTQNTASGVTSVVSGGNFNTASSFLSSVSSGSNNTASGGFAAVSGGNFNTASGDLATVSGGSGNIASGTFATVSGGTFNTASGEVSSVSGGDQNTASGERSSVSGGARNTASGFAAAVSGGQANAAIGAFSAVSGGQTRDALGEFDWVAGNLIEDF